MILPKLASLPRTALAVYGGSLGSFRFTLFVLPRIHLHATPQGWAVFAYGLAFIGFTTLVDLGAAQIIPREISKTTSAASGMVVQQFHALATYSSMLFFIGFVLVGSTQRPAIFATPGLTVLCGLWVAASAYYAFLVTTVQAYRFNIQYSKIVLLSVALKSATILALMRLPDFNIDHAVAALLIFLIFEIVIYRRLVSTRVTLTIPRLGQVLSGLKHRHFWMRTVSISSGGLVAQSDRLGLIHFLSASEYGRYIFISTFGLLFLALEYPVLRYLTPRFHLVSGGTYRILVVFSLCISTIGIAFVLLSVPLFEAWSRTRVDPGTKTAIRLLCSGMAIQALYNLLYLVLILEMRYKEILAINIAAFSTVLLTAFSLLGRDLGIAIGGILWISASSLQLVLAILVIRFGSRSRTPEIGSPC